MAFLNSRGQSVIEGGDVISRTPINENTEINSTWSDSFDNFLGAELTGTNSYQCIQDGRIGLDEPMMIIFTKYTQNTSNATLEILTNKGTSTDPRVSLGIKKILDENENELAAGAFSNINILEYRVSADSGNGAFILKDISREESKIGIVLGSPHGFVTQDIVHFNGTTFELADYTVVNYKRAIGIVKVLDANSFELYFDGIIEDLTGFTLTAGAYYASTTQIGKITQTYPTANAIHKILEVFPVNGDILATVSVGANEIPFSNLTRAGIVKLNNTLISTSTNEALTAAQGENLKGKIDNLFSFNGVVQSGITLEIKSKDIDIVSATQYFAFDDPFPNVCIGVWIQDNNSNVEYKQGVDSFDLNGFTATTSEVGGDVCRYFSIGF